MTKPFSQELYDTYNESVINQVTFNLHIKDHMILLNSDRYDVDLVILDTKGIPRGYIEVEYHGKYWIGPKFPFNTTHFLGRKIKYAGEHVYYILVSRNGTGAIMIPINKLITFKPTKISNVYMEGETMYDVPIDECVTGWEEIAKFITQDLEADLATPAKKVGMDKFI